MEGQVAGTQKYESGVELVAYMPFITNWLRQHCDTAGDLLVSCQSCCSEEKSYQLWSELMDGLEEYGDLTPNQLKRICSRNSPEVCASALMLVLTSNASPITTPNFQSSMLEAMKQVHEKDLKNGPKLADLLAPPLSKMQLTCLEALAQVCALIRDTSTDPHVVARELAIPIFVGNNSGASNVTLACKLMTVLVEFGEYIFGKPAQRSCVAPLGIRPS
mmetsp:Transcript_43895/g.70219  ORF Transcript_43895/g.70219 Transcript_43895/m.70219 type:complete len:218 (+) Transcript_43895:299-952(+)|eukprot:CAMPEP_0203767464 /NCGR_PEP_ID=MMETSP0099_2-20121227/1015_1 /ASSEMBLY_ACC=CAM_ASM_000209 /TAXON_ID=96639 /ORGANISM=" , Strain NY0313808BC1" /LENGTH=217 /DNA_ID=CAMNT_0050663983 /DNA_START=309 /DNA_END=962 /DNA_ORIENTATION=-